MVTAGRDRAWEMFDQTPWVSSLGFQTISHRWPSGSRK
jgi:hypothetical protein